MSLKSSIYIYIYIQQEQAVSPRLVSSASPPIDPFHSYLILSRLAAVKYRSSSPVITASINIDIVARFSTFMHSPSVACTRDKVGTVGRHERLRARFTGGGEM